MSEQGEIQKATDELSDHLIDMGDSEGLKLLKNVVVATNSVLGKIKRLLK